MLFHNNPVHERVKSFPHNGGYISEKIKDSFSTCNCFEECNIFLWSFTEV